MFFHVNRSSFNVGALFWAKTARITGLDPIFDSFQGSEKTPKIQKSLITPRFLQLRPNKWQHRIPCLKINLPDLFKIVSYLSGTLFRAFFVIFRFSFNPGSKNVLKPHYPPNWRRNDFKYTRDA